LRKYTIIAVSIIWVTVVLRLCLDVYWSVSLGTGAVYGLLKFITAFTSLANILIGLTLTASLVEFKSPVLRVFARASVLGCAVTYITVMAGVFALLIAPTSPSVGLQRIVGGFLHGFNPVVFLAYWFFVAPKRRLKTVHAFVWPVGAIVYFALILIRGAATGIYPYPFVDAGAIGYSQVALNAALLLGVFIAIGLSVVAIDRWVLWGAPAGHDGR